jgi:hypothetical protein
VTDGGERTRDSGAKDAELDVESSKCSSVVIVVVDIITDSHSAVVYGVSSLI